MKNLKLIIQSKNTLRLFALFGIISFIFEFVVFSIMGFLRIGYNPLTQYISELGECGAPNSTIVSLMFIFVGMLLAFFSISFYYGIKIEKKSWIGPVFLALFSIFDWIGSGIFPCDPGCAGKTFSGQMHLIVSVIGMFFMTFCPIITWKYMKKDERWHNFDKFTQLIGIIIPVLIVIFIISVNIGFLIGLTQRILYWTFSLWILVIALKLLKIFKA